MEHPAAASAAAAAPAAPHRAPPQDPACRRIQVSREKRPLNFFVALSKKFLTTDEVVELSGLGLAVTTVVTIAEILRTSGFVSLEHIQTSLVEPHPDGHTTAPKAKIQIWIRKTPQFDSLMTNHNSHHHSRAATSHHAAAAAASQLEAGNTNPAPAHPHQPPADHPPGAAPPGPSPASAAPSAAASVSAVAPAAVVPAATPDDPAAIAPTPALQTKS